MDDDIYDLLIVGGGINGTGIARDAAGRGLRTILFERDDLAEHTSSKSTKLIHGGLRYLEYREFRLVREALQEREVLLRIAPHLIRPLRFVLPHSPFVRPAWMIRLGLMLYDRIGGRISLPGSQALDLRRTPEGAPLQARFRRGFAYSDAWVDDARLVVLNALDAAEHGAEIHLHSRVAALRRTDDGWACTIARAGQAPRTVRARAVVNAAGPWVEAVRHDATARSGAALRLVKGSHIVTRRRFDGDQAYILQNPDKRIVFAIPYAGDFTLIGTTDENFYGDPAAVAISAAETAYLCDSVNRFFADRLEPGDVVWSYAGVRPLYDDHAASASAVTRDYVLDLDDDGAPLLSVYGGKITTYRRLAEHALDKLGVDRPAWTGTRPLPGGDRPPADVEHALIARYPFLEAGEAARLAAAYGTRAFRLLGTAARRSDLGRRFGPLSEAEARYLVETEWAAGAEDIMWRRTKSGLRMTAQERADFSAWLPGLLAAKIA